MARLASFDLPLDPEAPSRAREAVKACLVEDPRLDDALLATSEIVTNAVRHGAQPRGSVSILRGDHTVRVEVSHPGGGFSRPGGHDPQAAEGRGLRIVEAVVDRWGTEATAGTLVWFELETSG